LIGHFLFFIFTSTLCLGESKVLAKHGQHEGFEVIIFCFAEHVDRNEATGEPGRRLFSLSNVTRNCHSQFVYVNVLLQFLQKFDENHSLGPSVKGEEYPLALQLRYFVLNLLINAPLSNILGLLLVGHFSILQKRLNVKLGVEPLDPFIEYIEHLFDAALLLAWVASHEEATNAAALDLLMSLRCLLLLFVVLLLVSLAAPWSSFHLNINHQGSSAP